MNHNNEYNIIHLTHKYYNYHTLEKNIFNEIKQNLFDWHKVDNCFDYWIMIKSAKNGPYFKIVVSICTTINF